MAFDHDFDFVAGFDGSGDVACADHVRRRWGVTAQRKPHGGDFHKRIKVVNAAWYAVPVRCAQTNGGGHCPGG